MEASAIGGPNIQSQMKQSQRLSGSTPTREHNATEYTQASPPEKLIAAAEPRMANELDNIHHAGPQLPSETPNPFMSYQVKTGSDKRSSSPQYDSNTQKPNNAHGSSQANSKYQTSRNEKQKLAPNTRSHKSSREP